MQIGDWGREEREVVALLMVVLEKLDQGKGSPYMHGDVRPPGVSPRVNAARCTAFFFLYHVLPGLELCKGDCSEVGDAEYEI